MSLATSLENRLKGVVNSLKRPSGTVDMTWLEMEEESSESSEASE